MLSVSASSAHQYGSRRKGQRKLCANLRELAEAVVDEEDLHEERRAAEDEDVASRRVVEQRIAGKAHQREQHGEHRARGDREERELEQQRHAARAAARRLAEEVEIHRRSARLAARRACRRPPRAGNPSPRSWRAAGRAAAAVMKNANGWRVEPAPTCAWRRISVSPTTEISADSLSASCQTLPSPGMAKRNACGTMIRRNSSRRGMPTDRAASSSPRAIASNAPRKISL